MANMDGRKQRFEANPMQAQMEAKRKKDEEEAAKKAAAEARAAKLAMWGEPAKGTKKASEDDSSAADSASEEATAGKPKKLDSQLKNLVRAGGVKRGAALAARGGRGGRAARVAKVMGDGESVEGDLDPKKAEEEAIEAEKLAKVQAQVRAAMLASGGMPSPIVTSKATPAHKPSSLSKPAVESDNSDNDGGSDFDVPDGPAPVISEPPNMGTRTRRQSMTIPAAALSNILGNGKDGAGSPPAAAPQAPKIIEISVPIEPKVSPVTLSAARQQAPSLSISSHSLPGAHEPHKPAGPPPRRQSIALSDPSALLAPSSSSPPPAPPLPPARQAEASVAKPPPRRPSDVTPDSVRDVGAPAQPRPPPPTRRPSLPPTDGPLLPPARAPEGSKAAPPPPRRPSADAHTNPSLLPSSIPPPPRRQTEASLLGVPPPPPRQSPQSISIRPPLLTPSSSTNDMATPILTTPSQRPAFRTRISWRMPSTSVSSEDGEAPPTPPADLQPAGAPTAQATDRLCSCSCPQCSSNATLSYEVLRALVKAGDASIKRCTALESRLSAEEFSRVFEVSREAFHKLPSWQQTQLRKKTKLHPTAVH